MIRKRNPQQDLRSRSRRMLELGIIVSLILHVAVFIIFPKLDFEAEAQDNIMVEMQVEDIPQTQQIKRPPPPERPSVPIASEDEDIMDDVTIEDTDFFEFDDDMLPPPPPPPEDEEIPPFLPLEDQPKIIGGYEALYKFLKYPEIARKAGIEGIVIVAALIGKTGIVEQIRVDKSLGNNGCDEAAIEAVKKVKFTPAKQRGRPVKFWYRFPIRFKLTGNR